MGFGERVAPDGGGGAHLGEESNVLTTFFTGSRVSDRASPANAASAYCYKYTAHITRHGLRHRAWRDASTRKEVPGVFERG